MANYKKMYYTLFRAFTKIHNIIEEVQQKTEDIYLDSNDAPVTLLHPDDNDSDD